MLFDGKHRPKGLEFASCRVCNEATRKDELVVSLLSRFYPQQVKTIQLRDVKKLFRDAERHNPGLLAEMQILEQDKLHQKYAQNNLPSSVGFLRVDGPIVSNAVARFAAKLGFALHCEHTGTPVSQNGGVAVTWYSNVNIVTGDRMPNRLLSMLGPGQTLEMGSFRVPDQFRYSSLATDNNKMSGHLAVFRESFAIEAVVKNSKDHGQLTLPNTFFQVGCFLS